VARAGFERRALVADRPARASKAINLTPAGIEQASGSTIAP
jgi:hypothetical protein